MIFEILGVPVAKQSFKIATKKTKDGRIFSKKYQPKKIDNARDNVRAQIIGMLPAGFIPFRGPLRINKLIYIYPVLKSFSKKKMRQIEAGETIYKHTIPDLDNSTKLLWDSMQTIVYLNDSQICEILLMKKIYGLVPKTIIDIEEIIINKENYCKHEIVDVK